MLGADRDLTLRPNQPTETKAFAKDAMSVPFGADLRQYTRKPRTVPFDDGRRPNKRIKNARKAAKKTNEHQPVDGTEGLLLGGGSSQNNDLLPQR